MPDAIRKSFFLFPDNIRANAIPDFAHRRALKLFIMADIIELKNRYRKISELLTQAKHTQQVLFSDSKELSLHLNPVIKSLTHIKNKLGLEGTRQKINYEN